MIRFIWRASPLIALAMGFEGHALDAINRINYNRRQSRQRREKIGKIKAMYVGEANLSGASVPEETTAEMEERRKTAACTERNERRVVFTCLGIIVAGAAYLLSRF